MTALIAGFTFSRVVVSTPSETPPASMPCFSRCGMGTTSEARPRTRRTIPIAKRARMLVRPRQEAANHFALLFVADPCEQSWSELVDRLRSIERQTRIHLAAREVAWHAALFEDRPDVLREISRSYGRRSNVQ